MTMLRRAPLLVLLISLVAPAPAPAQDPAGALRPPVVGLMRHGGGIVAIPGQAAPVPGCDPGAVLTEEGREEMRRFGARLRAEGITAARLFSSRQCSAWETALLLEIGPVRHHAALDPFTPADRDARRHALRRALLDESAASPEGGPAILITHRANIADLTGIELTQGNVLLLRAEAGRLLMSGRITSD
jgi:phosphohistidine phosphatase SixA